MRFVFGSGSKGGVDFCIGDFLVVFISVVAAGITKAEVIDTSACFIHSLAWSWVWGFVSGIPSGAQHAVTFNSMVLMAVTSSFNIDATFEMITLVWVFVSVSVSVSSCRLVLWRVARESCGYVRFVYSFPRERFWRKIFRYVCPGCRIVGQMFVESALFLWGGTFNWHSCAVALGFLRRYANTTIPASRVIVFRAFRT